MSAAELDALYDLPRDLSNEARDRLAEVQTDETKMAQTVWGCAGSQRELRERRAVIVREAEDKYLEENQNRLLAFQSD